MDVTYLADGDVDWTDWLHLPQTAFIDSLSALIDPADTDEPHHLEFVALYNALISGRHEATRIADLAAAIADVMLQRERHAVGLLFLELEVRSRLSHGDLIPALAVLEHMASLVSDDAERQDVLDLADDAWGGSANSLLAEDIYPLILVSLTRVFRTLADLDRLAKALLTASAIFEDQGALDTAQRALSDAREVAETQQSFALLAEILEREATITYRRHQFEEAMTTAQTAWDLRAAQGQAPSAPLANTIATSLMHLDRDAEAIPVYEDALALLRPDEHALRSVVLMNLAACRRKMGRLAEAQQAIDQARLVPSDDDMLESNLELELIAARIATSAARPDDAVASITAAARWMDNLLSRILRLHRRRGVRDRYVVRFEMAMRDLPDAGDAENVLPALATVRGSLIADWLSLLDWAAEIQRTGSISDGEKGELQDRLDVIKGFGAPFLYGFREKYDDPWEPVAFARPWDELGVLIRRLHPRVTSAPYDGVKLDRAVALLRQRLAEGYALAIPTFGGTSMYVWIMFRDRYRRVEIPAEATFALFGQRILFQQESISRDAFNATLASVLRAAGDVLHPEFDRLLRQGATGMLYFQDLLDCVAMPAIAMSHATVRGRIATGDFEMTLTPVIYPARAQTPVSAPRLLSISDESEALMLAGHEAEVAARLVGATDHMTVQANDQMGFDAAFGDADMMIVSTHGRSIAQFTDPYFAHLGGGTEWHVISVDSLQRLGPSAKLRVAILNACHSGASAHKSLFATHRTHDLASYPNLLLLNGAACVSAAGWRISDTAGFAFNVLAARFLSEGDLPVRALGRTVAKLRDLRKSELFELLDLIADEAVAAQVRERLQRASEVGMFSASYLSGGIQVYSLL